MPKLAISRKVSEDMKGASWIRAMFEKGRKLKAEFGEANVHDFSLGNPNASPPPEFFTALRETAAEVRPDRHRYMPNGGFDDSRAAVAAFLSGEYRMPFDANSVILTSGAAGATNVAMRAILDPGDEVIVFAPYFPEYKFYIEQAGGRMIVLPTDDEFQPDMETLAAAINPRTRAVLVNSPNNPSGAVYSAESCGALATVLRRHDREEQPIYLLCDDVYRRIIYDIDWCSTPIHNYPRSLILSSYSKDLSIAGERMGYIAVPPAVPQRELLLNAMTMLNRTMGFVNAGAFMQRVVAKCADARCDLNFYRENRDLLCTALREYGYDLPSPAGALYAFPRTPLEDDPTFVNILLKHRILAVPGQGFGRPGYMRLSYCIERATIERALPGFKAAIEEVLSRV